MLSFSKMGFHSLSWSSWFSHRDLRNRPRSDLFGGLVEDKSCDRTITWWSNGAHLNIWSRDMTTCFFICCCLPDALSPSSELYKLGNWQEKKLRLKQFKYLESPRWLVPDGLRFSGAIPSTPLPLLTWPLFILQSLLPFSIESPSRVSNVKAELIVQSKL